MSEVRQQLLVLENAVAVARATVGPSDMVNAWDFSAILKAAAFIDATEAAIDWSQSSQMAAHPYFQLVAPSDNQESITAARVRAESALEHFDELEDRPHEAPVRSHLSSAFTAARAAEEIALPIAAERQAVEEAHDPLKGRKLETPQLDERSSLASRRIEQLIDASSVRRTALELLPAFVYGPGEDLPIFRMKQESPLEVVVILIGSAGALVALLNGLLDVQVKYKTRKEKARAERSRLERELAEDEARLEAVNNLKMTFSANEPERLKMQDFTVFDSLEEAFEDDGEMKAT
jgi:hypothetical protein